MALVTVAPIIYSEYKRKDNTYSVRMRIYYKKVKIISTNIVARPDQLTRNLTVKDPTLKRHIDALKDKMQDAANAIPLFELKDMDVNDVVSRIEFALRAPSFSLDFPTYAKKIADEKPVNSRSNYTVAINSLCKFMGTYSFDIKEISSSLMHNYEVHLKKRYGENARAVSLYTKAIAYIHRRAREEFNNEERGEIQIKNPFAYYKCPTQKPTNKHRDIDTSILQGMIDARKGLKGAERIGVDLFLFSFCMIGMNTPDIYDCEKPKKGVIHYYRTKTRERRYDDAEMYVRVEPCALDIVSEYLCDADSKFFLDFHKRYKNYKELARAANRGLVKYCERVGIKEKITIYSARHTWSTLAYSLGIPESTVNNCLCHVDSMSKINSIYINRDWSVIWEANKRVLDHFKWD